MTHQEKLLRLAGQEKECPGDRVVPPPSYGILHALAHCTRCDDTGKVLRFPTLRQSSEYHQDCIPFGFCNLDAICKVEVGNCQGRGWLPADNLEAELDIASKLLPGFILWPYAEDGKWIAQYR